MSIDITMKGIMGDIEVKKIQKIKKTKKSCFEK